ncbi:hypothetical protein DIPPA_31509 [Diplonema papillatum]|nr:hypothetical protein DIPPA_31509 [Diplonema papillatum]
MPGGGNVGVGVVLARKLVRSGMKSSRVRDRIRVVLTEKRREAGEAMSGSSPAEVEAVAGSEAATQLLNEAFAELRFRSLLLLMKTDLPRVPLPSTTQYEKLTGPELQRRPVLPTMTAKPYSTPPTQQQEQPEQEQQPQQDGEREHHANEGTSTEQPKPEPLQQEKPREPPADVPGSQKKAAAFSSPLPQQPADDAQPHTTKLLQRHQPRTLPSTSSDIPLPDFSAIVERPDGYPAGRAGSRLGRLYHWWTRVSANDEVHAEKERGLRMLRDPGSEISRNDLLRIGALAPVEVRFLVSKRLKEAMDLLRADGPPSQLLEALKLCRQCVAIMQTSHGTGHPGLFPVLNVYAVACAHVKAVPQCELAVRILDKMYTVLRLDEKEGLQFPLDPLCFDPKRERGVLLSTMMQLASHKGQHEDVAKYAREALQLFGEVSDDDETIRSAKEGVSLTLGVALCVLGRDAEADLEFKKALVDMAHSYSPSSASIAPHLQMLSLTALRAKNFDEAQTLAALAYKNLHTTFGEHDPRTMTSMRQVAEICLQNRQYRLAAKWLIVLNRMYIEHLTKHGTALQPLEHARALHLLCLSNLGLRRAEPAMQIATHSLRLHDRLLPASSGALRDPLLAWCTAYRMVAGHAKKNGALYVFPVLERFLGILNANRPPEPDPAWYQDRFYVLLHLSLYHLWMGSTSKSSAAFHELLALCQSGPRVDFRLWMQSDVERIQYATLVNAAWPEDENNTDFQTFLFLLAVIFTADQIVYVFTQQTEDPAAPQKPEDGTESTDASNEKPLADADKKESGDAPPAVAEEASTGGVPSEGEAAKSCDEASTSEPTKEAFSEKVPSDEEAATSCDEASIVPSETTDGTSSGSVPSNGEAAEHRDEAPSMARSESDNEMTPGVFPSSDETGSRENEA